ncbi:MAG TPA: polysaccharide deacetylase family protein [bacterium]|nr:polysaccharide deacetylase family protein [bacterium]
MRGSVILCYHHIVEAIPADPLDILNRFHVYVEARRFRQQMEILARRYSIVPLDEILTRLADGTLRAGLAAVTLDDGYADNYSVAFPLLERLGVPATIFLATGYIEHGLPFWWDRLSWHFCAKAGGVLSVPPLLGGRGMDLRTRDTMRQGHFELRERLRALDGSARNHLLDALGAGNGPPGSRPLAWHEVSTMRRRGVGFGAHSEWHSSLVALSPQDLREEIGASRDHIAVHLGDEPTIFAYPYGNVDARVSGAVAAAGFLGSVTTRSAVCAAASDRFLLPRISVGNCSRTRFARILDTIEESTHEHHAHIPAVAALKRVLPGPVWTAGRHVSRALRSIHHDGN